MFPASITTTTINTKDDHIQYCWTPMDCCIGATLTEAGLLQRTPTEVELYTAISTRIHSSSNNSNNNNNNISDASNKCTIELRAAASSGGGSENDITSSSASNNNNSNVNNMVPLTLDGNIDTTKSTQYYRDRTYFPFQMMITTHRIVFFRDRTVTSNTTTKFDTPTTTTTVREARYIHLSNVFSITTESFYFKSPKIILSTAMGELILAFLKGSPFTTVGSTNITTNYINPVKLRDEMYTSIMKSYTQKQWDIDDTMEQQRFIQRKMITSTKVGVDAIISHTQQRHAHAKRITDRAFESSSSHPNHQNNSNNSMTILKHKKNTTSSSSSDHLETFLMEATELVQVIQKYVATLDRSVSDHESNNDDDTDKLVHMLQDMGMTSILNRNNTTTSTNNNKRRKNPTNAAIVDSNDMYYYDTIARQVVDLIRPKLQRQTVPMITLTDVYCMYNRSRGTQLISPEELLYAMEERLNKLHLNLSVLTFPHSGLKVVQDPTRTNLMTLTETFLRMCQQNEEEYYSTQQQQQLTKSSTTKYYGYVTALSVSQQCHIPTILAYEQLQMVEQNVTINDLDHNSSGGSGRSKLVRDETLEVVRFYPNLFF